MSIQQTREEKERGQAHFPDLETPQLDANIKLGSQSINIDHSRSVSSG